MPAFISILGPKLSQRQDLVAVLTLDGADNSDVAKCTIKFKSHSYQYEIGNSEQMPIDC